MLKAFTGRFGNDKITGAKRRALSLFLAAVFLLEMLTSFKLIVAAADPVYPKPAKIYTTDAGSSTADNTAWYKGYTTQTVNGVEIRTLLSRYDNATYALTAETVTAALGTEDKPYIIETGLELANLAETVNSGTDIFTNKYIRLAGSKANPSQPANVIDLIATGGLLYQSSATEIGWVPCDSNNNNLTGWTPIGTSANRFNGSIYADAGVKIYNLSANLPDVTVFGLFGYTGADAQITNFDLVNVHIYNPATTANSVIGSLVAVSGSTKSITNCSVKGLPSGTRTTATDGSAILSSLDGGNTYTESFYTVPEFSIRSDSSTAAVGGLVGRVSSALTIQNTQTDIDIFVDKGRNIGSIAGNIAATSGTVTISDVTGSVSIRTPVQSTSYMYHVGGIAGDTGNLSTVVISNIGSSTVPYDVRLNGMAYGDNGNSSTYGGFGGVLGFNLSPSLTISSAYIQMSAKLNRYGSNVGFYVGGIVGRCRAAASAKFYLTDCHTLNSLFANTDDVAAIVPKITVGGILGGANYEKANSYIRNCSVRNTRLSCDGFTGGIVGLGVISGGSGVAEISGCTVSGLEITQSIGDGTSALNNVIGGIAAAITSITTISDCTVTNSSINLIPVTSASSYHIVGGICGRSQSGSITGCLSDIQYNITMANTASGINPTGLYAGGICGYAVGTTFVHNTAIMDYNLPTTVTNTIEATPRTFTVGTKGIQSAVCGGLIGYTGAGVTVTGCYTSGDINLERPEGYTLGNRQNSIGGLIGAVGGSLTMSLSFSTASLSANLQDAVGGLIGFNNSAAASLTNCHFGGTLLSAHAASVVNYSVGGTFSGITVDRKWAPNSACAEGGVTAANQSGIPAAVAAEVSSVYPDYYAATTANSVTFTGSHVFAVTSALSGNYEIKTNAGTSGSVTVTRRVRLVRNLIDSAQDGLNSDFGIGSNTDLNNMQDYVAAGGGFLGSAFVQEGSFSSSVSEPVGMAAEDTATAAEDNQPFCGSYDGKGYTLTLTASKSSYAHNGLFGYIQNAYIHDLNIIYSGSLSAPSSGYAGGVVGYAAYSKLDNLYVKATGGLTLSGLGCGGVAGYLKATVIGSTSGTKASFTGKLVGGSNTGGIAGQTSNIKPSFMVSASGANGISALASNITLTYSALSDVAINTSYAAGDIIGNVGGTAQTGVNTANTATAVGGIIGYSSGGNLQIKESFAFGNVTGGKYAGGLIGLLETGAAETINSSYMNGNIYANDYAGGIAGYILTPDPAASLIASGYFAGQIECIGSVGALTSGSARYYDFYYDKQVAGELPICANMEDDTSAEVTGGALIAMPSAYFVGEYVDAYSNALTARDINTSNPVSGTTYSMTSGSRTATAKFTGTWTYSAPSNADYTITASGNNNRFSCNNSTAAYGETTSTVEFTFKGTYFDLYDYVLSAHDGYKILIDGVEVGFNQGTYTAYNANLNTYSQPFAGNGENATVTYLSKPSHGSYTYSVYVSTDVGLTSGSSVNSFSVSGLSYGTHTITVIGVKTKSSSQMYIRGFVYGSPTTTVYVRALQNFTQSASYYPQLTAFASAPFAAVSQQSTQYIYNFTANGEITSNTFKSGSQVTVGTAVTCDKTDAQLASLGVTRSGSVYSSASQSSTGGIFNFTTTRSVDGYSLAIKERIIVVPFSEGAGSLTNPFQIRNVSELVSLRSFINDIDGGEGLHFKLTMGDSAYNVGLNYTGGRYVYDLGDTSQNADGKWNISIGTPERPFGGNFDGNGKVISNISIDTLQAGTEYYAGLFGYVTGAHIENVTVEGGINLTVNLGSSVNAYAGSIAAVAVNSTIKNSSSDVDLYFNYDRCNYFGFGVVGGTLGNTTVYGVLSKNDVTVVDSVTSYMSDRLAFGGIVGYIRMAENNQTAIVDTCVAYGNFTGTNLRTIFGGLAGLISNVDTTTSYVKIQNSAFYGSIDAYSGHTGGLVGHANVRSTWYVTLTDNVSTASLSAGNNSNWDIFNVGGLVGYTRSSGTSFTLTGNTFGGELNGKNYKSTSYIGGLFGYSYSYISTLSLDNYYDGTKNPNIASNGYATRNYLFSNTTARAASGGRETSLLTGSNDNYDYPDISAATFGSALNAANAGMILIGNSVSVDLVRTDSVYSSSEADAYISISSAFLSSANDASLSVIAGGSSVAYRLTAGNKRAVSTGTDTGTAVTVQAVRMVGGYDAFGGYGKKVTYYPSTKSTGKIDASYIAANPSGDGLTGSGLSFTLYTADQLAGLDAMLKAGNTDGYGNRIASAVGTGYTVYLAADIDYTGIDYMPSDSATRTFAIGDDTHHFTGTFDGQYHTIYGMQTASASGATGLFAALSGATIKNTGITDSSFAITGSGSAGSFCGTAVNTNFTGCFSSARVEQGNVTPSGVYVGGFAGTVSGVSFTNCFFTGSVGVTAVDNASYITVGGTGEYYAGGFAGMSLGTTAITNSYVASYIHGSVAQDETSGQYYHNIGYFVGDGNGYVTLSTCKVDASAGAEGCYPIGGNTNVSAAPLSTEGGYYPSVWAAQYQTVREKAARIAADFSASASSMSRVEIIEGFLSNDDYLGTFTVYGTVSNPLYEISTLYASRSNSGTASILIGLNEGTETSYRVIVMNLQCWYDNFTIDESGNKVYTIKNVSDLGELAIMVREGSDANVGHNHSIPHTGTGIAQDRFATATVKLGINLDVNGEILMTIGVTPSASFAGTFDGNGYTISNADFESVNGIAGLFGYISPSAVIKNVLFSGDTNVTVGAAETETVYVGSVIARYENGSVSNCYNGANISVKNLSAQDVYFGGIAGMVGSGMTLSYCSNMGHIQAATDGMYIAGISGRNSGTITMSYNTGIIDGYTDELSPDYKKKTTVGGICAANTGEVSQSYNSGVLRYYAENKIFPIADGTVLSSAVDGRYLTPQYRFREVSGGYEYSAGTTVYSTEEMSGGAAFSGTWSGWTHEQGYYPQFSYFYEGVGAVGGARKVYSTVSTLAPTLTPRSSEPAAFDAFNAITFRYGSYAFLITQNAGNLATFTELAETGSLKLTVLKRGSAIIYLTRNSGEVSFTRETYFINEENFTVKYMFDFSVLTANTNEASARQPIVESALTNTFADAAVRSSYGNGSAGSPYLINTAADLLAFADYINNSTTGGLYRYFELVRSIDCSAIEWTPIGTQSNPFRGNFNGNGCTISGITSSGHNYNGLFGYAGENSTIQLVALTQSIFTAKTGTSSDTYTGALVGYTAGVVTNCYSRAVIEIPDGTGSGRVYAGGLVGKIGASGILRGCYVRPAEQTGTSVPDGKNTIVSYYTGDKLLCGIIAGETGGVINGCYHTAAYYEPTGYSGLSAYGIVVGSFAGGEITDTFYDSTVIPATDKYLYVKYADTGLGAIAGASNRFAKTTAAMKQPEASASTNGVANDGIALLLSQNMYLGTYEMAPLPSTAVTNSYINDGYPLLAAFDLAQYQFASFSSSNIILCMQNIDASEAKLMNALCTYESYDFPTYADITAKAVLNASVFSLPKSITYNVSAVGYGLDGTGDLKWTAINGDYTNTRGLYENQVESGGTMVLSTGHGSGMTDNLLSDGSVAIAMNKPDCLPTSCYKMYIYITLKPSNRSNNSWGVYHTWDSSSLQELPEDELLG